MNTNTPVILFVDDEKYWLKRTAKTLERFDYKILTAISASEGKAILRDGGVHVLLLDLDLPGENGLDILRWTKEHYPHIEVIMYSGEGTIGTALQSIKMGAYDFIEKNSDVEELLVTIRNAVEKSYLEFQILEAEHGLIGR
ncbi:MAG: response regulator, partial [bacterium]